MKKFAKILSAALVLLLVAGLLPGMSLTALADDNEEIYSFDLNEGYIINAGKTVKFAVLMNNNVYLPFRLMLYLDGVLVKNVETDKSENEPDRRYTAVKKCMVSEYDFEEDRAYHTIYLKSLEISDATIEVADTSFTYDAESHYPTVTVKNKSGDTLTKGTDYTLSENRTDVGIYSVTVTGAGDYIGSQTVSDCWSITKGTNSFTTAPVADTPTYTGEAKNLLSNGGAAKWGTIEYSTDNSSWSTSIPQKTGAGEYTVYYRVPATANYDEISGSVTASINKATGSISYTETAVSKTFGDEAFTNELTKHGDGSVSYSSGNTGVATVNSSTGEVTIVGAGTATVTATVTVSSNYSYMPKTASYNLTVARANPTATAPSLTATYGQTLADLMLSNPSGNTAGTWTWAVDTSTSVGDVGEHTFIADFTPTDATNYNSKSNVDVTVTVGKADPATPTGLQAKVGQKLSDVKLPEGWKWDAPDTELTETGDKTFPATFTETTNYNGKTANLTVKVSNKPVTSVTLDKTSFTLKMGETSALTATVAPADADNKAVTWSVSPEGIVTVDASGKVTAKAPGKATVTVTTADGNKTAACEVTVPLEVKNTKGNGGKHKVKKDGSLEFVFEIDGDNAGTFDAFKNAGEVVTVTGKNYSRQLKKDADFKAESGSLKLTLTKSYLDSLKAGDYTVTAEFKKNGVTAEGSSTFKITASSGSSGVDTGDDARTNNIVSALILFLLSLSFIAYTAYDSRFRAKLLAVPAGISSFFNIKETNAVDSHETDTAIDEPENIVLYDAASESASESDSFDDDLETEDTEYDLDD